MPRFRVEELTDEINQDAAVYYDKNCPHGCEEDGCEGHFADENRLFQITNLFDRDDGDGGGVGD